MSDLRLAFRHLRQSPGYALSAVLTLAFAIGANSAIYSAVHAVLLRPMPIQSPGELAVVWQTDQGSQAVVELTHRHLREWMAGGNTFQRASLMASHNWSAVLQGRGEPTRIWFAGVSGTFFDTLSVTPFLGRTLSAEDDVPNGPSVAVLNYDTWVRRFGSDPSIVGTTMTLDGSPTQIVGVMPQGLNIPRAAEFWTPVVPILASGATPNLTTLDTLGVFYVVGRLRPGLHAEASRGEIDALEAQLDASTPGRPKWGSRAVVMPFHDYVFGPVRPALLTLWAAVGILLLVACANVSGLMLTRVSLRRREHAIRLALGATRIAIARLWLAEALILSIAGGVLGVVAAGWLAKAIVALAPDDVPHVADIAIDGGVALFTFAAVLVAALLTALMPVRHASDATFAETLDGDRATTGRQTLRARSALLVVQIGMAVVLLVATGLVVRSFVALRQIELGFQPDRVLSATVQPRGAAEPPNVWLNRFLTRVRAMPQVESAGAIYLRPLMLGPIGQGVRVTLEGEPDTQQASDQHPTLNHQIATPGYFETMKVPLLRGRFFDDRDVAGVSRVAIVGESTAQRLWPGQDPLGRKMRIATFTPGGPPRDWRTVVGVVKDVRYRGLDEVQLDVYDPALQVGRPADTVVVRTAGQPLAIAAAVRALAREMDAAVIVDELTTMERVVERAQAPWRLTMWMFLLFGCLAFGLAALGLFSLVALDVAHRGREFAIRLTLGASHSALLTGVLRRAAVRVIAGVMGGVVLARLAAHAMRGLLFGVGPDDIPTYAAVFALVVVVVGVAAVLPALRALRANPQALLRHD